MVQSIKRPCATLTHHSSMSLVLSLTPTPDRPAVNALLGHPNTGAPALTSGVLGDCAAAVLMKVLYGARMGTL